MAYQRAYFPMKYLNVTQGYGEKSSTHKLSYAIDFGGKDSGRDEVYAPFDCRVSKVYKPSNTNISATTIWLTSTRKVLCSNGYYGYLTMSITHPIEIMNMNVGMRFKQGDYLFREGNTGNATGNHIHIELATGTYANWVRRSNGTYSEYVISNKVRLEDYIFLREDTIVLNEEYKGYIYDFKKESELTYVVRNVPSEPLRVHSEANYNRDNVIGGLKNGDEVIKFYNRNGLSYIYHYEMMGYVASNYLYKL